VFLDLNYVALLHNEWLSTLELLLNAILANSFNQIYLVVTFPYIAYFDQNMYN
jgi:hypothetical protein